MHPHLQKKASDFPHDFPQTWPLLLDQVRVPHACQRFHVLEVPELLGTHVVHATPKVTVHSPVVRLLGCRDGPLVGVPCQRVLQDVLGQCFAHTWRIRCCTGRRARAELQGHMWMLSIPATSELALRERALVLKAVRAPAPAAQPRRLAHVCSEHTWAESHILKDQLRIEVQVEPQVRGLRVLHGRHRVEISYRPFNQVQRIPGDQVGLLTLCALPGQTLRPRCRPQSSPP